MAWKHQYTNTTVGLDDFSSDQLLQGLIDNNWISELEAEAISKRASMKEKNKPVLTDGPDAEEYAEAYRCLRSGFRGEAMIHLERFLGRDWIGVLS